MDRIIVALAIALALLFVSVTGVANAGTGVSVDVKTETRGFKPKVTLAWGNSSETIVIKTNASRGYTLRVRATSLTGGIGLSLADIRVEVRKITGTTSSFASGSTAGSTRRTDQAGDVYEVRVSTWQPFGSPIVDLAYDLRVAP